MRDTREWTSIASDRPRSLGTAAARRGAETGTGRRAGGLHRLAAGADLIVITWLHQADRDVLKVHPRDDDTRRLTGVFATRSPDRPNPLGLHRVRVLSVDGDGGLTVRPLEAIDGTPIVDIKPVLAESPDS